MMTATELAAKRQLLDILNKQGYPTYSRLLDHFHINLTNDPEVIAFMEPGKGRIVLNRGLDLEQVSMIVRHEILHEYLSHQLRMERHKGKDKWDKRTPQEHERANIAADYEISNRGYTDADKITARSIMLNGQLLQGLVTDIDHPDWVNLSMEEMYDLLEKEMKNEKQEASKKIVRIGDKGNQATQDAEAAQREAEAIIDDADEIIMDPSASQEEKSEAEQAKKVAQAAKDQAKKAGEQAQAETQSADDQSDADKPAENNNDSSSKNNQSANQDGPVFSKDTEGKLDKIAERIARINKALSDVQLGDKIKDETASQIEREKQIKIARETAKFRNDPLRRFVDSLNQFIRKEVGVGRGKSYGRINKTYANTPIIRAGITRRAEQHIPLINVYFDASASWDEAKIAVGKRGVATLNQYVRQGKLKIKTYYFSDHVSEKRSEVSGGSTGAIKEIFQHIKDTKADNVVIMTDGDMDSQGGSVSLLTVPGAVWFLFVDDDCDKLKDNLHGQKLTKEFFIRSK